MRTLLLLLLLPLLLGSGCAAHLSGRVVIATQEDRPVPGATVLVSPAAPLPTRARPNPDAVAPDWSAEVQADEDGRFVVRALLDEAGLPHPPARGWAYEVRAEALGYYSSVERASLKGRSVEVRLRLHEIEEVGMDGALRIEAAPDGRVEDLEGGLVDEVLRRQGRVPPGR